MSIIPFRRRLIPYRFFNSNYIIIGANLLVFMILMLFQNLIPLLVLSPNGFFGDHAYWQLLSYHLVVPSNEIMVLVFNMLGLFFFGSPVEREMGSIEYLIFYFGIGLLAGLFSVFLFDWIGLQGAPIYGSTITIFAILLAYTAFYPDSVIYLMGIFPLRAPILVLIFIGIELLVIITGGHLESLVNLIGLVFSFIYIWIRYRTNPFRNLFH